MQTFMANLKHAARNGETVKIGGGYFHADELKEVVAAFEKQRQDQIDALTRIIEWTDNETNIPADRLLLMIRNGARAALEKFNQ